MGQRAGNSQVTVNVRRLPNLGIDLETAFGNPPWLERVWSMLWTGAIGPWMHNDEPDNLLIALKGEMWVMVFNANDTDILSGSRGPVHPHINFEDMGNAGAMAPEFAKNNQWLRKFPFVF